MAAHRKPRTTKQQFEKPVIQKPENFDLEKGLDDVKRLIQRNKAWVKEMAAK